jgi:membrane-bound inhibitor of C-type lysozyme
LTPAVAHHPGVRAILPIPIIAASLAGCATHLEGHGPGGMPYACSGGRTARVTYEGGGWFVRARARLLFEGRTIELEATPPTYGLRYASAHGEGPVLVWTARGEEAWLTELADGGEREIARCTRIRS